MIGFADFCLSESAVDIEAHLCLDPPIILRIDNQGRFHGQS
jgi:hypothetical protein